MLQSSLAHLNKIRISEKGPEVSTEVVSCSAYSTMKMVAICSSETSIGFQRTTQRYIPEDNSVPHEKLRGFNPHATYTARATAAYRS
jgi:hypothetical protein